MGNNTMLSRSLTQQLFAEFLITTIVLGLFSALFIPIAARAAQPVFETNPTLLTDAITNTATQISETTKEWALDTIAFAIADALLYSMYLQTLAWVQGGQAPSFVKDWQDFFISAGTLAYTEFTNSYLLPKILPNVHPAHRGWLQSYIQNPYNPLDVDLSRITQSTLQAYGVNQNVINNYKKDFSTGGGWRTFEALSQPNNSPYNVYLQTLNAQGRTVASAIEANKQKVLAGGGFIDKTDPATGETTTPGSTIRDTIDTAFGLSLGKLEAADEIGEIIPSFILAGFKRLINQGLR